jgi:formylglycine-generating enzyme required for sulfatase activity
MVGNVFEWTRSLEEKYPYDPEDGREDAEAGGRRGLRGGMFDIPEWGARCAYRFGINPNLRLSGLGLGIRVMVAPGL